MEAAASCFGQVESKGQAWGAAEALCSRCGRRLSGAPGEGLGVSPRPAGWRGSRETGWWAVAAAARESGGAQASSPSP